MLIFAPALLWVLLATLATAAPSARAAATRGFFTQQTSLGDVPPEVTGTAVNNSTGYRYIVNGRNELLILDNTGALLKKLPIGIPENGGVSVAVDNSGGATQGLVYTNDTSSARPVEAFNADGEPHDFEASEAYIENNAITGTPSGPFGANTNEEGLAVDSYGNIYMTTRSAIDEYKPSGEFVRAFTSEGVPSGFEQFGGVAIDPTNGNVLGVQNPGEEGTSHKAVDEFSSSGTFLGQITGLSPSARFALLGRNIAVNPAGYLYLEPVFGIVNIFLPVGFVLPKATTLPATEVERNSATLHAKAVPNGGGPITDCHFEYVAEGDYRPSMDDPFSTEGPYNSGPSAGTAPCINGLGETVGSVGTPIEALTEVHAPIKIQAGNTYHYRISLTNGDKVARVGVDREFKTPPAVTGVKTGLPTEITNKSAFLHGSFSGEGLPTTYRFEYTTEAAFKDHGYGTAARAPAPDAAAGSGTGEVVVPPAEATNLVPGVAYVYRLVATNEFGSTAGENQSLTTFQAPTIEGFSTSHVTTTSADLEAKINPQGAPEGVEAECHFEYGSTTAYGTTVPCPHKLAGTVGQTVVVPIEGLSSGVTYHFRVLAESKWDLGEPVTSEDQTFEFFPPNCPNSTVRNKTGSNFLPDCRAYELVSPSNANATLLFSGGPNTGQATSPPRFAFTGLYGSLSGADSIDSAGDLYVSTRTDAGWVSKYVGLPGSQAGCMGGPPTDGLSHVSYLNPPYLTNSELTDPSMSKFLLWEDGTPGGCFVGFADGNWQLAAPSNAPYMFNADGTLAERLPTDLPGESGTLEEALKCQYHSAIDADPNCTGEVTASADLSHLAFSSNQASFASGGLTSAPGSAYDNDLAAKNISLISLTSNGENIPQDPNFANTPPQIEGASGRTEVPGGAEEYLRFPAVSNDGSHILISTATAGTNVCYNGGEIRFGLCPRFTATPVHLYMRVSDLITYEIAGGKPITFVGMTPDGSKVFFTSEEHLTAEDPGHVGASLYMWSQKGEEEHNPLTLISKGESEESGASGNTGDCHPALHVHFNTESQGAPKPEGEVPWTSVCSAVPISTYDYSHLTGGAGGNGFSDTAISANGDVYFYSPEQLESTKGVPGLENLYDYRGGKARYVTTLTPEEKCTATAVLGNQEVCTPEAVLRIDVSPDDSHMAFVTASRLSSYDNAHHLEMYSYTPATGRLTCDSCNPDGRPATADVQASQDGLFMANDGRTFFSTSESLVPQDTNEGPDVYEFVDGRPQLISPGTGTANLGSSAFSFAASNELPGLVGVSASGIDVYLSTFDPLVAEDHNGNFFRFYDARTDGGFAQPPPVAPCEAAEECHGPRVEAPMLPAQGTAATLTDGNATSEAHKHHGKKHHKRAKRKRHGHRANANRGGRK